MKVPRLAEIGVPQECGAVTAVDLGHVDDFLHDS